MAKPRQLYLCTNCGAQFNVWAGKCSSCGEWNTIEQEPEILVAGNKSLSGNVLKPASLKQIKTKENHNRLKSGIDDVDNVLGGGFVKGSINLIAGQPGIGKSTLLLQVASNIAKTNSVLYVSGEESVHQIDLRAKRLGLPDSKLNLATSTSADDVASTIASGKYSAIFVDSIQTMSVNAVASSAGSASQISNSTHLIMTAAKQADTAVILVGHVTKEGSIAGPKILEHVVDVVLNLEGDRYGGFKLLRSVKNRFGSTNEAGIFEMTNKGLVQVENPSASLLAERQASDGSVVLATMEGMRPVLVEVQALVNKTSYGYPKRAASGIDLNRVNLLVAMLERRTKLNLADQDIYINIVGGIKISEPAADLAICMAIGSAAKGLQLAGNAVVFGEIGLSGEVRRVNFADKRLAEAKKLGFDTVIAPKSAGPSDKILKPVTNIKDALNMYLKK